MVEHSTPPTPLTDFAASQLQCLRGFEDELMSRYTSPELIPKRESTLQMITAVREADHLPSLIVVRHYAAPMANELLEQQRAMLARMRGTSSPFLCELLESRAETYAHFLVGSAPGFCPLYDVLRQQRELPFETVAAVLAQLADGLVAATAANWPRMMLDIRSLFTASNDVDSLHQGLRLAVPPLPAPDMGVLVVPRSSTEYILELAILACELLGMRVQNGRFRPIAELGEERNQILRMVIENAQETEFTSARDFVTKLTGEIMTARHQRATTATAANPTPGRATSPTGPAPQPLPPPPPLPEMRPPPPPPSEEPTRHAPGPTSLPRVSMPDMPELLLPPARLRLAARSAESLPVVSIYIADEISVGRSPKANFIAQFAPATQRNKERTMSISKEHLFLSSNGADVWLRDASEVSHSFINGQAVEGRLRIGRFCRIMVAGEYELEIRRMDSAWPEGCVWDPSEGRPALPGATVLTPGPEISVYEHRVLWLFTDAAFGVLPGGALQLQPGTSRDVLGWFLTLRGCVWVMAAESDGTVMLDGTLVKKNEPQLLRPGQYLKIGTQEWQVEAA